MGILFLQGEEDVKFARSMFQTEDMHVQHDLLNRVSELVDDGTLVSTSNFHAGVLSVENLVKAHQKQESGSTIGKIVLDGFGVADS